MKAHNTELFQNTKVSRAVISLVVPTIISQIINVIYNIADTFFIGQMNDPDQVAAVTLAMPPFVMMMGIANLFGIGGASMIARCLGKGDIEKARRSAAFSIWSALVCSALYGIVFFSLRSYIFPALGTDAQTYGYCTDYVFWTIAVGAVPTVMSATLAHLVRAEGFSKEASIGMALGGILNIIFDPIFIFGFGMQTAGAAIATMLANLCSALYFVMLILLNQNKINIRLSPKYYSAKGGIPQEILLVGIPSFLMLLMGTVSNLVLNKLVVSYSNAALAGMGIAKKLDMLAFAIANGMTQGVLPLVAYNYSAKNFKRMKESVKTAFLYSITIATVGTLFLLFCAVPVSRFFIDDPETVKYGQHFLRIICITCPAISVTMMTISIFQATGKKIQPLILSFVRKGGIDVPFMFIMNYLVGADGIPWATPISDLIAMTVALSLFIPYWRKLSADQEASQLYSRRESN